MLFQLKFHFLINFQALMGKFLLKFKCKFQTKKIIISWQNLNKINYMSNGFRLSNKKKITKNAKYIEMCTCKCILFFNFVSIEEKPNLLNPNDRILPKKLV
jgi:hypothetical protein